MFAARKKQERRAGPAQPPRTQSEALRKMETSEKNSRNNMQGTRQCGAAGQGPWLSMRCARGGGGIRGQGGCNCRSMFARAGRQQHFSNSITKAAATCATCNVQQQRKSQAAAVAAAANKLKYWQAALVLKGAGWLGGRGYFRQRRNLKPAPESRHVACGCCCYLYLPATNRQTAWQA